jgi:hypothetical protein
VPALLAAIPDEGQGVCFKLPGKAEMRDAEIAFGGENEAP